MQNREQLNRLETLVLEISEREQRRIGQDIHDGLSQQLSGIAYLSHLLLKKLRAKSLPEAQEAARIIELVNDASEQARAVARGLSPVRPDPSGLMVALRKLALTVEKTYPIGCWFVCEPNLRVHDNTVATHLYRIAQEAVHNAVKHSKADEIVIHLCKGARELKLIIEDNGSGPSPDLAGNHGLGFETMKYRARAIGGRLEVQTRPDQGLEVVCSLPLPSSPPQNENDGS